MNIAIKLEAYESSLSTVAQAEEPDGTRTRQRSRKLYTMEDPAIAEESSRLQQEVAELRHAVNQSMRLLETYVSRAGQNATGPAGGAVQLAVSTAGRTGTGPSAQAEEPATVPAVDTGRDRRRRKDGKRRSKTNDPCHICCELGHWAKECPKKQTKPLHRTVSRPK